MQYSIDFRNLNTAHWKKVGIQLAFDMSDGKRFLNLRPLPAAIQRVAVYETRTVSREGGREGGRDS